MDEALPDHSEKPCVAVQEPTTDGNSWPTDRGGEHVCLRVCTSADAGVEIIVCLFVCLFV